MVKKERFPKVAGQVVYDLEVKPTPGRLVALAAKKAAKEKIVAEKKISNQHPSNPSWEPAGTKVDDSTKASLASEMTEQLKRTQVTREQFEVVKVEVLRELKVSGGIPYGRLSLEVLYLLPRDFVDGYVKLFWEALDEGQAGVMGGGRGIDQTGKAPGKRDGVHGPQAAGGGKKYKTAWAIKSEKALKKKEMVDKRLLDLIDLMELKRVEGKGKGVKGETRQCMGCRRFMGATDKYCAGCGLPGPIWKWAKEV